MSDNSAISWTDATWNVVIGCQRVSRGCTNCYAIRDAHRMGHNPNPKIGGVYGGLAIKTAERIDWTGVVRCLPERLELPLRWRQPRRVFVNSMSDLFQEQVPFSFVAQVWDTMRDTPRHTYQILTKRPGRMRTFLRVAYGPDEDIPILPNVHLGVSVESQDYAWRIDKLRQTPAAVRFISAEPLLGPQRPDLAGIDWVLIGGESGPGARPLELAWVRDLIAQCRAAGVAVFVKQMGSVWAQERRRSRLPADAHGADWQHWALDLCVREFPALRPAVPVESPAR